MSYSGKKPRIIFLMGPTASGKTDLALALHQHLPVDLISVDSTQVYRGMDIGTAKPSAEQQHQVRHRLIDIRDPAEVYSVADFCKDVQKEIQEICASGRIPLLVGGTMMYFNALLSGLADVPEIAPVYRQEIEVQAQTQGWPALHQQLSLVDPELAATIHPNHSQRISRALEVYRATGQTMSEYRKRQSESEELSLGQRYDLVQLAVGVRDRSILHERIARRFEKMMEQGFLDEVKSLRARGDLHSALPALRAVGYRQLWEYLDAKSTGEPTNSELETGSERLQKAKEKAMAATRQLAKRQLTWLRRWSQLNWVYIDKEPGNLVKFCKIVDQALNFLQ